MANIKLANSDIAFTCDEDDTIMRAAVRAGLGFPYECNVGSCGNCRFELVEGAVEHDRQDSPAYNERDKQRNRWLGCQAKPNSDCQIKVRLSDHYVSRFAPQKTPGTVTEIFDITHDIREFRFKLDRPARFLPGQYALLYVPHVTGARAYSMCNVTRDGAEWHFQIKKVPDGKATTQLFDAIKVGSAIEFDGPFGMAYLREDAPRDVLCLAGGSGLSPMVSIARGFAEAEGLKGRQLHFVYGGRRVQDVCGEDALKGLPGWGERIHYYPVISMPDKDPDAASWTGKTGLITDVAKEMFGDSMRDFEIYFAGPPAMARAVMQIMMELKVPPAQIHFDEFY
ncbi:MAG: Toluene-4-monooxygenase electron transfer component [Pseudomonadota bacterium]|jgi:toluene monooxygenase electron transfer component